jgi:predicted DNA-binding transcriptional regulator AlpA
MQSQQPAPSLLPQNSTSLQSKVIPLRSSDSALGVFDELLTVSDLATFLKCKESSIYNLSRRRAVRYAHELPILRFPFGLRFRKSDILEWIAKMASSRA